MLPADTASAPVHTTKLHGLEKIHTGKVRDIYAIDAHSMLIVTTDRLSAFDFEFLVRAHDSHRAESPDRPKDRRNRRGSG
jgi:hypothetical protein